MAVLRLYPGEQQERPLEGLYLDDIPNPDNGPFIYANFLVSLDGRIAVRDENGHKGVPQATANDRDWRLYTELLVQADAVLTTGHHAQSIAAGAQDDMMTLAHRRYPDLRNYRRARGLSGHPTCVVVSSRLNFRTEALKAAHPGAIMAITTQDDERAACSARNAGIETIVVRTESTVRGHDLTQIFRERGLKRIYMVGGPRLFHALLRDQVVRRLYLTMAGRLVGGDDIETPVRGPHFTTPPDARLRHLTLDRDASPQQMFACYDLGPH